jgi:hypothetical protein
MLTEAQDIFVIKVMRQQHTIAKERRITYSPIMAQLPRASLMHALAAA